MTRIKQQQNQVGGAERLRVLELPILSLEEATPQRRYAVPDDELTLTLTNDECSLLVPLCLLHLASPPVG